MIRHAALFKLKHKSGSEAERDFLETIRTLAGIPGLQEFELARETSPKNHFDYVVSMRFADEAAYAAYNDHPLHVSFVQTRWLPEVEDFMEHDSVAL